MSTDDAEPVEDDDDGIDQAELDAVIRNALAAGKPEEDEEE